MAILKPDELDILSHSTDQTRRFGARLGSMLQAGDVICLSGDMGAGKTMFTTGIGIGWGSKTPVTSPTYNLIHEHRREKDNLRLYHLDCYRLDGTLDADSIGLDDILDDKKAIIVFEWPERIEDIIPRNRLWIELLVLDERRRNFVFEGKGKRAQELIKQFQEATFGV